MDMDDQGRADSDRMHAMTEHQSQHAEDVQKDDMYQQNAGAWPGQNEHDPQNSAVEHGHSHQHAAAPPQQWQNQYTNDVHYTEYTNVGQMPEMHHHHQVHQVQVPFVSSSGAPVSLAYPVPTLALPVLTQPLNTYDPMTEIPRVLLMQGPGSVSLMPPHMNLVLPKLKEFRRKRTRNPEKWKRNNYKRKPLKDKGPCNCPRKCFSRISETNRLRIRQHFHSLTKKDQDQYLLSLIQVDAKKLPATSGLTSIPTTEVTEFHKSIILPPEVMKRNKGDGDIPMGEAELQVSNGSNGLVSAGPTATSSGATDSSVPSDVVSSANGPEAHQTVESAAPEILLANPVPSLMDGGEAVDGGYSINPALMESEVKVAGPRVAFAGGSNLPVGAGRGAQRARLSKRFAARYFVDLMEPAKIRFQVCHFAFLSLLGIGKKRVDSLVTYYYTHGTAPAIDKRGKHGSRSNKIPDDLIELARQHIVGFPRVDKDPHSGHARYAPDLNVVKMHRSFIARYQPALLEIEKISPQLALLDRRARKKFRPNLEPDPQMQSFTRNSRASGPNDMNLMAIFDQLACFTCEAASRDTGTLVPCFYIPHQETSIRKKPSSRVNMYLLGLFCSQECVDHWVHEVRFPAPLNTPDYNPIQCPFRSYKEISPDFDTKDWLRPLVSRDKYDRELAYNFNGKKNMLDSAGGE